MEFILMHSRKLMKQILEFNYPEDEELFKLHLNGPEATWLIESILGKLRYDLNHSDSVYEISADKYIDQLQKYINDEIKERQIIIE